MRYLFLFFVLTFASCDDTTPETKPKTLCEQAKDHIYACVGYLPAFTCNQEQARKILDTPCENITSLWR